MYQRIRDFIATGQELPERFRRFTAAALEFMEIENNSDKGYDEIISTFQNIASRLPLAEKKLEEMKTEIGSLNNVLTKKKSELAGIQSQLAQLREETIAEKTRLNEELEAEKKRLEVKEQEVKEVNRLKSELVKRDLDAAVFSVLPLNRVHRSVRINQAANTEPFPYLCQRYRLFG